MMYCPLVSQGSEVYKSRSGTLANFQIMPPLRTGGQLRDVGRSQGASYGISGCKTMVFTCCDGLIARFALVGSHPLQGLRARHDLNGHSPTANHLNSEANLTNLLCNLIAAMRKYTSLCCKESNVCRLDRFLNGSNGKNQIFISSQGDIRSNEDEHGYLGERA